MAGMLLKRGMGNGEWEIEKWEHIKKLNNIKIGKNMK